MKSFHLARPASICTAIALSCLALAAGAQQTAPTGHEGMNMSSGHMMNMGASSDTESSPSTKAYKEGGMQMMKGMNAPYVGDADQDFVSHMIPHHQGAVDMAKVELKYGTDPEMRKLAQEIIKAQKVEIANMKKWQAEHPVK